MMNGIILILPLVALLAASGQTEKVPECRNSGRSISYLEVAADMIGKAQASHHDCSNQPVVPNAVPKPLDCAELSESGVNRSGVYRVWPRSRVVDGTPLDVYCDMDTDGGGWTVIQRRGNYSRSQDYFFKNWESYKKGFGDKDKDFWLGNDAIFALSNQRATSLRFDLSDVAGERRYALYDSFFIDDEESKYKLHIADYSGDAGDSMIGTHNNQKFSTKDSDNDANKDSCAQSFKGAWWYNACHHANLNGLDLRGKHESFADGIEWHSWKGYKESLGATEMKLRPRGFRKKVKVPEAPLPKAPVHDNEIDSLTPRF